MRLSGILVALAFVLVSCAHHDTARFGEPGAQWVDASGRAVSNGRVRVDGVYPATIFVERGAAHCEWQDELFLGLAWPLGSAIPVYSDSFRQYVWDPDDSQHFSLRGTADAEAHPPADAVDTGYRLADAHLWIAPSDADDYIYIKREGTFQRWPRANRPMGCS